MGFCYVLVVRDPDGPNEITTDGEVIVIDIDLGSSFDGKPDDNEQACEWVTSKLGELDNVPAASNVFSTAIEWLTNTVEDFPDAVVLVDAYVEGRE